MNINEHTTILPQHNSFDHAQLQHPSYKTHILAVTSILQYVTYTGLTLARPGHFS